MPVLIALAGYFAYQSGPPAAQANKLVRNIFFVHLTFLALQSLQRGVNTGTWAFDPARPIFAMWFLLALVFWRVALPYVPRLRFAWIHVTAAAIAVGFSPAFGTHFAAARTAALFPLFLLGVYLRRRGLPASSTPPTPPLRHHMDYRPNTQNPGPPTSLCCGEPYGTVMRVPSNR